MKKSKDNVKKSEKYIIELMNHVIKRKKDSGSNTAESAENKEAAKKFEFKKYVKESASVKPNNAKNEQEKNKSEDQNNTGEDQNGQSAKPKPETFSQGDVIRAILEGRDVIANIPTGGGKTLCYQAPALCMEGITLVISPLQALCRDQVNNFNKQYRRPDIQKFNQNYRQNHRKDGDFVSDKAPQAVYNASIGDLLSEKADESAKYETKLLYMSPEKLDLEKFKRDFLNAVNSERLKISRIVFDEAHCVFMWGFDFRESYLKICSIVNRIKKEYRPPIAAFSATLTAGDFKLLEQLFEMKKPKLFRGSVIREDLDIFIINCDREKKKIGKIKGYNGSMRLKCLHDLLDQREKYHKCIIYCSTKYQIRLICRKLERWNEKWKREGKPERKYLEYHADLFRPQRKSAEKKFSTEECDIIVATTAFGMGIDNNRVDLVIHFDIPASIEDYYQQIGRAGRNPNMRGKTVLLYEQIRDEEEQKQIYLYGTMDYAEKRAFDAKLNNIYSGNVLIPRLSDSAKEALICLTQKKFIYLNDYIDENLEKFYDLSNIDESDVQTEPQLRSELFGIADYDFIECSQNTIREYFNADNPGILENTSIVINDVKRILRLYNELHVANALVVNNMRKHALRGRRIDSGAFESGREFEVVKFEPVNSHSSEKIRKIKGFCFIDNTVEWRRRIDKPKNEKSILKIDISCCSGFLYVHSATFNDLKIISYAQKVWNETDKLKKSGKYLYIFTDVPNNEDKKSEKSYLTAMVFKKIEQNSDEKAENKDQLQLIDYSEDILKPLISEKLQYLSKKCAAADSLEDIRAAALLEKKPNKLVSKNKFDEMVENIDRGSKEDRSQKRIFIIDEADKSSENVVLWYSDGTPYTENPLTYFDMCVADAIYTIEINGYERIYPLTIWRILSGNENLHFSRSGSQIKAAIEASIEKMRGLNIRIRKGAADDITEVLQVYPEENTCFLPLNEVKSGGHVYEYNQIMPLYDYCQKKNGQIIKLPVYRFDGRRHRKMLPESMDKLKKSELLELKGALLEEMENTTFINTDYRSTLESVVMYHYLQRRISIYRHTNRSSFINLNTLAVLLWDLMPEYRREDMENLKKRVESYLFWCLPTPYCKNSGTVQYESYGDPDSDPDSFGIRLYKDIVKKSESDGDEDEAENHTDSADRSDIDE